MQQLDRRGKLCNIKKSENMLPNAAQPIMIIYLCFCIGQVSRYKGCSYVQKLQKAKKSAATLTNGENFVLVKIPHRATGLRLG